MAEIYENVAFLEKEAAKRFKEFLIYSEIDDVNIEEDNDSGIFKVQVKTENFNKAENLYHIFSENELNSDENGKDDEETDNPIISHGSLYESTSDKYKENMSSAITFFVCGGIGLVVLALNYFKIIDIFNKQNSNFMFINIVLFALFAGFILIGAFTLKYSKKIQNEAKEEDDKTKEILEWLETNIIIDDIESSYNSDIPDEMKYFSRSEFIKNKLKEEYKDINDSLADSITDTFIENIF